MVTRLVSFLALVAVTVAGAGCGGGNTANGGASRLNAGGATFPDPLVQKWAAEYRTAKGVEIDYVKKGSGYGISQVTEKNFAFGCTDAPMDRAETDKARGVGGEVIHVPVTMGAVAVIYNLPEAKEQLKLSGPVVAGVYTRKITKWNDKAIAELNPGVALPDKDITPVARAEGSGTTNIFTEYLNKAAPDAFPKTMVGKQPKWAEGVLQQEGSDGVTSQVKTNPYSLGYVEVLYAKKVGVAYALLKNKAGEFRGPDPDNVTAAAAGAMAENPTEEPYTLHELTFSLTDAAGRDAYPIAGASYAILYRKQPRAEGRAAVDFLKWAVTDGQKYAKDLEYAPLPAELAAKIHARLDQVTFE